MSGAITSEQTQEEVLQPRLLLLPVVRITAVREHADDPSMPCGKHPVVHTRCGARVPGVKWRDDMKRFLIFLLLSASTVFAVAQTGPAWSPAKSIGMFAYPKNQQNADQQLKDESDCYGSARQNTGIDPQAPPPAGPSVEEQQAAQQQAAQQAKQDVGRGRTVVGAARGAAGGAAIGAIAGDAGQGAAIGATVGAISGRRHQRMAEQQAQQQAAQQTAQAQQQSQAQAQSQHQAAMDTFKRAFSACMDARGYSVQ